MNCRIVHVGQFSDSIEGKTRVRQGRLLVIDCTMKITTGSNSIQWIFWTQVDDLNFADDQALLSHNYSQMHDKTTHLETTSAGTGVKINRNKTELMKINTTTSPVTAHQRGGVL
jgi:hypothetical protein